MDIESHILGAFDTLSGTGPVTQPRLLAELLARGISAPDARLALERALLEGWLTHTAGSELAKPHGMSPRDRWALETPPPTDGSSQKA